MLSYHHSFHTGNHTNILKHTIQSLIIKSLKEKDKPFLYLNTHTGARHYQLGSKHAKHTSKYLKGITHIWQQDNLPTELEAYINVVKHFNHSSQLHYYPSSPLIAHQLLHEQDSLQLTKLHPSNYPLLHSEFQKDSHARVKKANSFQQLKAKLPPVSHHGLILINPPYEMKTDYQAVVSRIAEGYKHFATGTYTLWYPVVLHQQIKHMIHNLEATSIHKILQIELAVLPDSNHHGMTTSSMIVINPPWKLEQQMNNMLPWLHSKLVPAGTRHTTISWIMPE